MTRVPSIIDQILLKIWIELLQKTKACKNSSISDWNQKTPGCHFQVFLAREYFEKSSSATIFRLLWS